MRVAVLRFAPLMLDHLWAGADYQAAPGSMPGSLMPAETDYWHRVPVVSVELQASAPEAFLIGGGTAVL